MTSMMLQLKTSRMKKRLSNNRYWLSISMLAILGLLFILTSAKRSLVLSHAYGFVELDFPILSEAIADPSFDHYQENPSKILSKHTTALILSENQNFYFGELSAFGQEFHRTRNKFIVHAKNDRAQLGDLLKVMEKWLDSRKDKTRIKNDKIVVFLPANTLPANIIIQIVHRLRQSHLFDRVILANGLI